MTSYQQELKYHLAELERREQEFEVAKEALYRERQEVARIKAAMLDAIARRQCCGE